MKDQKRIIKAIVASVGLWLVHMLLHQYAEMPYMNVGYGIAISLFLYLAFIEEKIFKK